MHSSASDGTCEPARIAQMAVQTDGLSVIALTDHDSLAGFCLPPSRHVPKNGIEFVPGVEITTRYDGRTVHMLGYFVDGRYPALVEYLDENRRRRAGTCLRYGRFASRPWVPREFR